METKWKAGQIVTIGNSRFRITKRETTQGSVCDECHAANNPNDKCWYEQRECPLGMNGTLCHCNMSVDCYPKLLD